jgi:hypothetical protein
MFKLEEHQRYIDVQCNDRTTSEFPVPINRKYPETKEEAKKTLIRSVKIIEIEFRYMIGIIHFTKAHMLRPVKKSVWFKDLIPLYWQILNLFIHLGIHPVQQKNPDETDGWENELDVYQE